VNTAIVLILILGVSIFIHELGHYLSARLQGVRVPAFSIGFGPPLLRFRWAGTEWRLSLIPLGGYAEIEGMAPDFTPEGKPLPPRTGFAGLSLPGKVLVLVGGVLMNLLLAWFLMAWVYTAQGIPKPVEQHAQVISVVEGSLAQAIGLQPGDLIVAIDGRPLQHYTDLNEVKAKTGPHTLTVVRDGRTLEIRFVWDGTRDKLGVRYGPRWSTNTPASRAPSSPPWKPPCASCRRCCAASPAAWRGCW
jgi:regulator of sigma E protease